MKAFVLLILAVVPLVALAEGRCPPGQYPIGGVGVGGCAPIPGSGTGAAAAAPRPIGKWETRWGAIVEDSSNLSTGASISMKTRRDAIAAATQECRRLGGVKCELRLSYHNQCAAIADPTLESRAKFSGKSIAISAINLEVAKSKALKKCEEFGGGQDCSIVYSACSESEFREF